MFLEITLSGKFWLSHVLIFRKISFSHKNIFYNNNEIFSEKLHFFFDENVNLFRETKFPNIRFFSHPGINFCTWRRIKCSWDFFLSVLTCEKESCVIQSEHILFFCRHLTSVHWTLPYLCSCLSDRGLWLPAQVAVRSMSSSGGPGSPYTSLAISQPAEFITHVELNRPEKRNAMNKVFWRYEPGQIHSHWTVWCRNIIFTCCSVFFCLQWDGGLL